MSNAPVGGPRDDWNVGHWGRGIKEPRKEDEGQDPLEDW